MTEEKKYKYVSTDVVKVKLDFEKLAEWHNPETDLPVCGFVSLYEASGLVEYIKKYCDEHKVQVVAADNLLCNFYTLQHIRNFIEEQWKIYSLDIKGDNEVVWDTKKYAKWEKHYPRKLPAKIKASITADFANFSCGVSDAEEDGLNDDEILFIVYTKEEIIPEN